jgi:hypothetical protein
MMTCLSSLNMGPRSLPINPATHNFVIEGKGEFKSMYLDDIEEDKNPGVAYANDANTPSDNNYGDMVTD